MSALKRLTTELRVLTKDPPQGITARPADPENMFLWEATIGGPENSPYRGGSFKLILKFPKDYPFTAPNVRFATKIFHPNIGKLGTVCLDVLDDAWSPALDVGKLLLSISSLLSEPNPDDPLHLEAGQMYRHDREAYSHTAREWTRRHATPLAATSGFLEFRENGYCCLL